MNNGKNSTDYLLQVLMPPYLKLWSHAENLLHATQPAEIEHYKRTIIELVTVTGADLCYSGENRYSALQMLKTYYDRTNETDALRTIVQTYDNAMQFMAVCERLFQPRWSKNNELWLSYQQITLDESYEHLNQTVSICLQCQSMAEAALAAQILETTLYECYGIPFRSSTKRTDNLTFDKNPIANSRYFMRAYYTSEDCQNIRTPIRTNITDALLTECARSLCANIPPNERRKDYYDYCSKKYEVMDTGWSLEDASPDIEAPETLQTLGNLQSIQTPHTFPSDFKFHLLIITRTILCYGNYMHARHVIETLCNMLPQISVSWIVVTDADPMPETQALPEQITCYTTDAIWKLYPVIRALSLNADIVLSLPNHSLVAAEQALPTQLLLSKQSLRMALFEYNQPLFERNTSEVWFYSGIQTWHRETLGIIKPMPVNCPDAARQKLELLREDPKIRAILPEGDINTPLYFGYAYHPKDESLISCVKGIQMDQILALFIHHAKRTDRKKMLVLLPISENVILKALERYPTILTDCSIQYTNASVTKHFNNGSNALQINLFHTFPFHHETFRRLTDYAAYHETPIVATGDQSFLELFFTINSGFIFIYQLLEHKKGLLDALKQIASDEGLTKLLAFIECTENNQILADASALEMVAEYTISEKNALQQESIQLKNVLQQQPDLVQNLASIMLEYAKRYQPANDEAPNLPDLVSGFSESMRQDEEYEILPLGAEFFK